MASILSVESVVELLEDALKHADPAKAPTDANSAGGWPYAYGQLKASIDMAVGRLKRIEKMS